MPAKLPEEQERWTGRLNRADLDLLQVQFGNGLVNEVIRQLVNRYCDRIRSNLAGMPKLPDA